MFMINAIDATGDPPVAAAGGPGRFADRALTEREIAEVFTAVRNVLAGSGASPQEAQDAAQDAAIKTVNRAVDMSLPRLETPIAYAITVGLNGLRRARGRSREAPAQDGLDGPGLWSAPYTELELPLERAQVLAEAVGFCRKYLTQRQFEAFWLVHGMDLTYAQAAEALGVAVETIRSHLHDAVRRMEDHRAELRERLGL
jgi:DNA-directed RNA polymerase specialized sigma24 family protein